MPDGDISSLNPAGLQYYHRLIRGLLDSGIEPMVTMYHWDLPEYLQRMGGLLNPMFGMYFKAYAELLFKEFGESVSIGAFFRYFEFYYKKKIL